MPHSFKTLSGALLSGIAVTFCLLNPQYFGGMILSQRKSSFPFVVAKSSVSDHYVTTHEIGNYPKSNSTLFNRVTLPHRKGEGISYSSLLNDGFKNIVDFYESKKLLKELQEITKMPLQLCPEDDNHRVAVYKYDQQGDHINWHYDKSFYAGERVTVLVSLESDDANKCFLEYEENNKVTTWRPKQYDSVIFHGEKLRHRVTQFTKGKPRMVITMEFVTDPTISTFYKTINKIKDYIAYRF